MNPCVKFRGQPAVMIQEGPDPHLLQPVSLEIRPSLLGVVTWASVTRNSVAAMVLLTTVGRHVLFSHGPPKIPLCRCQGS